MKFILTNLSQCYLFSIFMLFFVQLKQCRLKKNCAFSFGSGTNAEHHKVF
jgi:3-hydroxy-3-methylglutaryl CoA synthase